MQPSATEHTATLQPVSLSSRLFGPKLWIKSGLNRHLSIYWSVTGETIILSCYCSINQLFRSRSVGISSPLTSLFIWKALDCTEVTSELIYGRNCRICWSCLLTVLFALSAFVAPVWVGGCTSGTEWEDAEAARGKLGQDMVCLRINNPNHMNCPNWPYQLCLN